MTLAFQLAEAFIGSTNLYHRIAIDAEVALLVACIFHGVTCRGQLVGKECLANGANLWTLGAKRIEQVGVVEINLIGLLKVCNTL